MLKVHVLNRCKQCDGEAYVFVGEYVDEEGQSNPRYMPCHVCKGSGEVDSWVSLSDFVELFIKQAEKDPMQPDWLELAQRKPISQYQDSRDAAGI